MMMQMSCKCPAHRLVVESGIPTEVFERLELERRIHHRNRKPALLRRIRWLA